MKRKSFMLVCMFGVSMLGQGQASDWLMEFGDGQEDWSTSNISGRETPVEPISTQIVHERIREVISKTKERFEAEQNAQLSYREQLQQQIATIRGRNVNYIPAVRGLGVEQGLSQSPRNKPEIDPNSLETASMMQIDAPQDVPVVLPTILETIPEEETPPVKTPLKQSVVIPTPAQLRVMHAAALQNIHNEMPSKILKHVPEEEKPAVLGGLKKSNKKVPNDNSFVRKLNHMNLRRTGVFDDTSEEVTSPDTQQPVVVPQAGDVMPPVQTELSRSNLGYVSPHALHEARQQGPTETVLPEPLDTATYITLEEPKFVIYTKIRSWDIDKQRYDNVAALSAFHKAQLKLHEMLKIGGFILNSKASLADATPQQERDEETQRIAKMHQQLRHYDERAERAFVIRFLANTKGDDLVTKKPTYLRDAEWRGQVFEDYINFMTLPGFALKLLSKKEESALLVPSNVTCYDPTKATDQKLPKAEYYEPRLKAPLPIEIGEEGDEEPIDNNALFSMGMLAGFQLLPGKLQFDSGILQNAMTSETLRQIKSFEHVSKNWSFKNYKRESFIAMSEGAGFVLVDDMPGLDGRVKTITQRGYFEWHRRTSEGVIHSTHWTKAPKDGSYIVAKTDMLNTVAYRFMTDGVKITK